MTNSRQLDDSSKAIDISAALQILAERQQHQHHHDDHHPSTHHLAHESLSSISSPTRPHGGGQVIDIFAATTETQVVNDSSQDPSQVSKAEPKINSQPDGVSDTSDNVSTGAHDKLKQEISRFSERERIELVLKSQEDRVATYRYFDEYVANVSCCNP